MLALIPSFTRHSFHPAIQHTFPPVKHYKLKLLFIFIYIFFMIYSCIHTTERNGYEFFWITKIVFSVCVHVRVWWNRTCLVRYWLFAIFYACYCCSLFSSLLLHSLIIVYFLSFYLCLSDALNATSTCQCWCACVCSACMCSSLSLSLGPASQLKIGWNRYDHTQAHTNTLSFNIWSVVVITTL